MPRQNQQVCWQNRNNWISLLVSSLILILCTIFPQTLSAREQSQSIIVLYENNIKAYRAFKETIKQRRQLDRDNNSPLVFIDSREISMEELKSQLDGANLVMTLGINSARKVAGLQMKSPYFHALITEENYQEIKASSYANNINTCALVIDQPLERMVSTAKKYIPELQRVGIITNTDDTGYEQDIDGVDIVHEYLRNDMHSTIKQLADKGADIIIATQNSSIYNSKTARNILISSYHFNIPLIGYSENFVNAGAILGIYSTPESYALDAYKLIKNPNKCRNNAIMHSSDFIVKTNPRVAYSLGIRFDN